MLLAAVDFDNLHQVLRVLYDEMMPLCGNMTGVAKGIAGLGALVYVAAKVWPPKCGSRSHVPNP
ncbi:Conjugative transposon protein TraJ [Bacteroides xylanisolvens SD CC 1b]|uniref:Conjugative transposon protein TraJ n=1 Tax=Bacteroides xylanisolvens SD CC 1b TaxID=702447 RepID=W6PAI1_9BACE|nr:Conjugative transposon protein TraJ [Bacteroides xylanisolvens SD CC 1b]